MNILGEKSRGRFRNINNIDKEFTHARPRSFRQNSVIPVFVQLPGFRPFVRFSSTAPYVMVRYCVLLAAALVQRAVVRCCHGFGKYVGTKLGEREEQATEPWMSGDSNMYPGQLVKLWTSVKNVPFALDLLGIGSSRPHYWKRL